MQELFLVRHAETAWSLSGQHTSFTDLPLTVAGEKEARKLADYLSPFSFDYVFTSPLQRARETCHLAGYEEDGVVDPDLTEWNYGRYEGKTREQIQEEVPNWDIFTTDVPGGESLAAISSRADRMLGKVAALTGNVLLFSSAHFLRVLTARFLRLRGSEGRLFMLRPASLSILGFEHTHPVIISWDITFY